uniref:Ig-like domain-containing protein n=1 Tax=Rhodnius prolixus TaxID=13249 RepID=T1HDG0_RHOPR
MSSRGMSNDPIFALLVLPFIAPFQFDGAVNAGDSVQLACHVSKGDIPLRIEWHFQGEGTSSHAMGVKTAMFGDKANILVIDSVGPGNRGEYTCTASNSAGVANHSAVLLVNGERF